MARATKPREEIHTPWMGAVHAQETYALRLSE